MRGWGRHLDTVQLFGHVCNGRRAGALTKDKGHAKQPQRDQVKLPRSCILMNGMNGRAHHSWDIIFVSTIFQNVRTKVQK
jgi:hypothetical protein